MEVGEKGIVLLGRVLVTETAPHGTVVLPFFVDESVETVLGRLAAAASNSAEPTGASWC